MKNRKAISATIVLILLWSLFGLISSVSYAENIPISEEGLERIGLNKIRLESGIGVIVFNLSKSYDRLKADGYLTVSNTYNTSLIISCRLIISLSPVDIDENGNPRIHPVISDYIIFKPIPDSSWIILEDDKATVNPCSIYNFRYSVDISLTEEHTFEANEGYLVYINVKKDLGDVTGAQVGIEYNYKLFLVFTGEQEQGFVLTQTMMIFILILPGSIIGGVSIFYIRKRRHKEPVTKFEPDTEIDREVVVEEPIKIKVVHDDNIEHKIDNILERKERERGSDG